MKGAIVVGGLLLAYLAVAFAAGLPPYGGGTDEEVTTTRGLPAAE